VEGDSITLDGVTLHVDEVEGLSIKQVTLHYDSPNNEDTATG
jgi:hypothetical protein